MTGATTLERIQTRRPIQPEAWRAATVPPPAPSGVNVTSLLRLAGLGFRTLAAATVGVTVLTMAVLGPFGFLPALFLAPLCALTAATEWVADRWDAATWRNHREALVAARRKAFLAAQREPFGAAPDLRVAVHDPPTARVRTTEIPQNVARVCHTLPSILQALDEERDLNALMNKLRTLRPLLAEHFELEETSGGLFEELCALEPSSAEAVNALMTDHTEILEGVDDVITRYGSFRTRLATGRHGHIRTTRRKLIARIHAHQQAENDLIQRVYGFRM